MQTLPYYWASLRRIYHGLSLDSPRNGPLMSSFDYSFSVSLNKLFSNQSNCRRCETMWCPYDITLMHSRFPLCNLSFTQPRWQRDIAIFNNKCRITHWIEANATTWEVSHFLSYIIFSVFHNYQNTIYLTGVAEGLLRWYPSYMNVTPWIQQVYVHNKKYSMQNSTVVATTIDPHFICLQISVVLLGIPSNYISPPEKSGLMWQCI